MFWFGATAIPFGPDSVAVDRTSAHLSLDVRDEGENLLPIPAHLTTAAKPTRGVGWSLVHVFLREALHQSVEIVSICRLHQPVDRREFFVHTPFLAR